MAWYVASGIPGYGPELEPEDEGFESLSDALAYARDELSTFVDMAHETAHYLGEQGDFEAAWRQVELMESLELLRANLDPARASAPLYRDDAAAYAALQASQAAGFPVDVSHNTRLYLWEGDES